MLIKHLRDDFRVPFATIVAIDEHNVGVAICNTKDNFNRKRGVKIAEGRAMFRDINNSAIPNRYVYKWNDYFPMDYIIQEEVDVMKERAKKYYSNVREKANE